MASSLFKTLTSATPSATTSLAGIRHFAQCALGAMSRKFNISEIRNLPDHRRRLLYRKYEEERVLYKAFLRDPDVPSEMREKFRYKLSMLPRDSSITRIRNRCILTGRSRGNLKRFRISRICFRDLANRGLLPGIKKASW